MLDLIAKVTNDDRLRRWSSIIIGRGSETIEIMTFYRLADSTAEGSAKAHTQYDEVLRECYSTKYHRNPFLKDLSTCIKKSRTNNEVKDFILMGDMDENVKDKSIQNLMIENGLVNAHVHVNNINGNALDNVREYGKKFIDVVMRAHGLIDYVAGCQLIEYDEVIINNHREHLLNIEIESCCQCKLNKNDQPNHTILNNTRKSHVLKFNEKVNEAITSINLKQRVAEFQHVSSREVFNVTDELFTKVPSKARLPE